MANRPSLIPDYRQLTAIDIPGNIRADRALDLQRSQLAAQRRNQERAHELSKAQLALSYAELANKSKSPTSAGDISLATGQVRYFQDPNKPDAPPVEAYIDKKTGTPISRFGIIPPTWKNVTSDVKTRQAEADVERKVRETSRINWEDNRADMRKDLQGVSQGLYQDLSVIESAIDNWQDVATGPGANIVAGFDKMKSFLGIEISPSSPALAQEYNQAFKNRIASKYFADQKGGLNEKEFTAIMDAAPDIHKTATGNMMLLEVERSIADWKLRRNAYRRSLLSDNSVGPFSYNKKMDAWDAKHSKHIIPLGLKKRIRQEQAKAKKVSYKDIFATDGTPAQQATPQVEFQMQDFNALGKELDQL